MRVSRIFLEHTSAKIRSGQNCVSPESVACSFDTGTGRQEVALRSVVDAPQYLQHLELLFASMTQNVSRSVKTLRYVQENI